MEEVKIVGGILLHYDDSSDEEIDNTQVATIEEKSERFCSAPVTNTFPSLVYSFCNYYSGLTILHAPEVKKQYLAWKLKHLSGSTIPSAEKLTEWVRSAIKKAIHTELGVQRHSRASKKMIEKCFENISPFLEELVSTCVKNLRILVRSARYGASIEGAIEGCAKKVVEKICNFLESRANTDFLLSSDFEPPKYVTSQNLIKVPAIREWIENRHENALVEIDQVSQWVKTDAFQPANSLLTPTKTKISSDKSWVPGRARTILTTFQLSAIQRQYIEAIRECRYTDKPDAFLKKFKESFLEKQLQAIIDHEKSKDQLSILQQDTITAGADLSQSAFAEFADELEEDFVPYDSERLRLLVQENLGDSDIQREFLDELKRTFFTLEIDVWRKTLPTVYVHPVNGVAAYIASLKLTNRSLARVHRNQSEVSILGDNKEENHEVGWNFPASTTYFAIERNRITKNSRSALMPIQTKENAYGGILKKVEVIKKITYLRPDKKEGTVSDRDIGRWVRQVLQCKPLEFTIVEEQNLSIMFSAKNKNDLTMFIIQLAHLLGGIEGMRYPGALVHNQMAIDLIIAGHLLWENALNPANPTMIYLPMAIQMATQVSRALIITCDQFTPYTHSYPGAASSIDSAEFKSFVEAEKSLTTKWFKFFGAGKPLLPIAIKEAIPRWYPGLTIK